MGIPTVIAMGVGTAITAFQQYQQGKAQAAIAKRNQELAYRAAQDARDRGEVEASRLKMRASALIGRQRAIVGSSGIDVESGSVINILADTAAAGELDTLTIENNAARQAWGLTVQGQGYGYQSELSRYNANWQAASTVIGGTAETILAGNNLELWGP